MSVNEWLIIANITELIMLMFCCWHIVSIRKKIG